MNAAKPLTDQIPPVVCVVVGDVIGSTYFNHRRLDTLLAESGAPGDPPPGNCVTKVEEWLKRASRDPQVDALAVLGSVLRDFMEVQTTWEPEARTKDRQRITEVLSKYGLSYHQGGQIHAAGRTAPVVSLANVLRSRDLAAVEREHQRALRSIAADPGAAVTAASSLLESLFKIYIEDEQLALPKDQSIKPLWDAVKKHLGLDPSAVADDDIKRILSGMASLVDGIGSLRTHAGSAHGRGRSAYKLQERHAMLAVNASYTLATFVIQTWNERTTRRK